MLATHFNPWIWAGLFLVALGFFCLLVVQLVEGWASRQETQTIQSFKSLSDTVHAYSEKDEADEQRQRDWHAQMLAEKANEEEEQRDQEYHRQQQLDWEEEHHMDGSTEPWLDPLHPWYEGH